MADFGHLKALQISETLAEYRLVQIEGAPSLFVAFAGETNKPYLNAVLRSLRGRSAVSARTMTPAQLDATRDQDREEYSRHIVKRWERVVDAQGQEVRLSQQEALQFLQALPNWLFDDLRSFCANPANFLAEGTAEAEQQGKD